MLLSPSADRMIFLQVILPVLLVFSAGFALQRKFHLHIKSVSSVTVYIFIPALVFHTFYITPIDLEYAMVAGAFLALTLLLIGLVRLYSWIRQASQSKESGLVLANAFMNVGNYGTPLVLFAYGQEGFQFAVSVMVLGTVMMNTLGVYFAARGQSGAKAAVKQLFAIPAVYTMLLAILWRQSALPLPVNFLQAIEILANAAIPTVMVVLGMQLADLKLEKFAWESIGFSVIAKLVLSPLMMAAILHFLPISPLYEKVLIVLAGMPTAATTTMYALQFDAEPQMVSSITLITTLLSAVNLTAILWLLG